MKKVYKWITRSVTNITSWSIALGVTVGAIYIAFSDIENTLTTKIVISLLFLLMFAGFNYINYLKVKREEELVKRFGEDYIKFLNKYYK